MILIIYFLFIFKNEFEVFVKDLNKFKIKIYCNFNKDKWFVMIFDLENLSEIESLEDLVEEMLGELDVIEVIF